MTCAVDKAADAHNVIDAVQGAQFLLQRIQHTLSAAPGSFPTVLDTDIFSHVSDNDGRFLIVAFTAVTRQKQQLSTAGLGVPRALPLATITCWAASLCCR